jgi:hypothetical protein
MAPLTLHRVTTLEQLEPLYQIGADAWRDDPLFNWFYPGGRAHPEDLLVLWKSILQAEFHGPGTFILAATIQDPEGDGSYPDKVVGFSVWQRKGSSDAARSWQGTSITRSMFEPKILVHYLIASLTIHICVFVRAWINGISIQG